MKTVLIASFIGMLVVCGAAAPASAEVIGVTSEGRNIVAKFQGDPTATSVIVAIGQMHGNEPGGRRVIHALRDRTLGPGVGLWTILTLNPDGAKRDTRVNARGVDLNRNFPDRWRPQARYFPGRHAGSELETKAAMEFLDRVKPSLVISYHQAYNVVDNSMPRSRPLARDYAKLTGLDVRRVPCMGPCRGTMIGWLGHHTDANGFTVELPGRVRESLADRHARAVRQMFSSLSN